MADVAAHVNLARRLGERKVGRTHPDLGVRPEHLTGEKKDRLLEVGERHVLVNVKALDLMEDAVRTGGDRLVPEHASRADHTDRKLHGLHRADLDGRRMRSEQQRVRMACGHEESVLHVSRWVVQREIQSLEHMIVVLNLRALGHIIAELSEYVHDLLTDNRHRMPGAEFKRNPRHGKILLRPIRRTLRSRLLFHFVNLGLRGLLEFVYLAAKLLLELRTVCPELIKQFGDLSFLAEKPYTSLLYFLGGLAIQLADMREQLFYFFFHNIPEIFLQS